ncbi:MAG: S8/S53 family peptidase [Acidimicrobiales bacterium]
MPLPIETRLDRMLTRGDLVNENAPLMGEYWHRPGQILVHRDDLDDRRNPIARELSRWDAERYEIPGKLRRLRARGDYPWVSYRLSSRMSIDAVVTHLRRVADGPEPRVAPNHVFGACQTWAFFPFDNPAPSDQTLALPDGEPGDCLVAVIDSGLVQTGEAAAFVNAAGPRLQAAPAAADPLDIEPTNGWLDDADGHGTFIAGIVLRRAPSVTVRLDATLNSGIADDQEVAEAILRNADADVINLSIGAYSAGNVPPPAIQWALNQLPPRTAVIAAAGNYGRRRPVFPGAFKRVIAVGAVDATTTPGAAPPPRAGFSGHGYWVDACASGQSVLSNYVEFDETPVGGERFEGWARWSGTSFATAHVSGVIAAEYLASAGQTPRPTPRQVAFNLLYNSGRPTVPGLGTYFA